MAASGVSGCGMSVAGCSVLNTTTTSRQAHQGDNDMDAAERTELYNAMAQTRQHRNAIALLIASDAANGLPPNPGDVARFRALSAELDALHKKLDAELARFRSEMGQ